MTVRFWIEPDDHRLGAERSKYVLREMEKLRQKCIQHKDGYLGFKSRLHSDNVWLVEIETEGPHVRIPSIPGARHA